MSIQLYIIGALEILIPIIALMFLSKKHKFRFSSVVCGLGCYFLITNFLFGTFIMFLSSVGLTQEIIVNSKHLTEIIYIIFHSVIPILVIYIVMKYVLKQRIRIYDSIALGISYWLLNAFLNSANNIHYGQVASKAPLGRLAELESSSVSLESLETAWDSLQTYGLTPHYLDFLHIIILSMIMATTCVFIFHALKRKNLKILSIVVVCYLIIYAAIEVAYFTSRTNNSLAIMLIVFLVAAIISVTVFMKYWKWYKQQQAELLRKKQEYAKYLKQANGNVVSVKPSESEDTPAENEEM